MQFSDVLTISVKPSILTSTFVPTYLPTSVNVVPFIPEANAINKFESSVTRLARNKVLLLVSTSRVTCKIQSE